MQQSRSVESRSKVTIRDVARVAGVSPTSVSNLLNGRDDQMGTAVRRRIRRAIEELNYQPSRVARQLRTGRGHLVGLIVPSVANPFWANFARVLEGEALRHDYQVMLCNSERDPDRERSYVDELWTSGVDTVVLGTSLPSLGHLSPAVERGLRLIAFDRESEPEDERFVSVSVDNRLGAFLASRHLLELGHRKIGFLSGAIATVSRRQRLAGYRDALQDAGAAFVDEYVWAERRSGGYGDVEGAEIGRAGATALLTLPDPPTALVTINDMYAIGALAAAREQGLMVPADLSIVGFDDIVLVPFLDPPLTTIAQPLQDMARFIVDVIRGAYSWDDSASSSVVMAPRLVTRRSTARPREL